jgi:lipopolysaccharide/colanic/teichoic acid biosynthesis glycosyltransferase
VSIGLNKRWQLRGLKVSVNELRSNITAFAIDAQTHIISPALKRSVDILIASLGLVFLAPLFALIALAIRRDTPGPVFYRGRRVGKNGKEFLILKFRTMYERPESYSGPKVTVSDDPRVTPLGHWLRETKINELPQLWNVLVGDMSLVGPRPEDPDIARLWPPDVWRDVVKVRPGITSPASVLYRNEETLLCSKNLLKKYMEDISPDKMRLDQLYIRYRSFVLDMDVLFWTFLILVPKLHNFSPPETLLFVGPVTRLMRRYLNWFMIDLIISTLAFIIMEVIWRTYAPLNLGLARSIAMTLGFALLFSVVEALLGVNRIAWSLATFSDVYDLLTAWLISVTLIIVATVEMRALPMRLVISASVLALAGFICVRYRSRLMVGLIEWLLRFQSQAEGIRERVLIVGANQAGQHAAWLLTHPANAHKFCVVGFVDNDLLRQGMRIYGAQLLGTLKNIPALIKRHRVSLVLLADHQRFQADFSAVSQVCQQSSIKLVVLPDVLATLGEVADLTSSVERGQVKQGGRPLPALDALGLIPATGASSAAPDCEANPCLSCLFGKDMNQIHPLLKQMNDRVEAGDL